MELNRDADHFLRQVNSLTYIVGVLGAIGMFFVANFQASQIISGVLLVEFTNLLSCEPL